MVTGSVDKILHKNGWWVLRGQRSRHLQKGGARPEFL
jgi:hypothetical protein